MIDEHMHAADIAGTLKSSVSHEASRPRRAHNAERLQLTYDSAAHMMIFVYIVRETLAKAVRLWGNAVSVLVIRSF